MERRDFLKGLLGVAAVGTVGTAVDVVTETSDRPSVVKTFVRERFGARPAAAQISRRQLIMVVGNRIDNDPATPTPEASPYELLDRAEITLEGQKVVMEVVIKRGTSPARRAEINDQNQQALMDKLAEQAVVLRKGFQKVQIRLLSDESEISTDLSPRRLEVNYNGQPLAVGVFASERIGTSINLYHIPDSGLSTLSGDKLLKASTGLTSMTLKAAQSNGNIGQSNGGWSPAYQIVVDAAPARYS